MDDSKPGTRDSGLYLFCFARSSLLPAGGETGLEGQTLISWRSFRGIAAVVSPVDPEEFGGPSAESRMQDLSWVGPRVWRHEEVVEAVMRHSPVLPARFGTLFSSAESLEQGLREHQTTISEFLDRVTDQEEWAVKVLLDRARAEKGILPLLLARESACLDSLSPGRRYFQERRIQTGVEEELRGWLREVCLRAAGNLNLFASDFCEGRLLSRRASEEEWDMISNWAFLVPRRRVTDFKQKIEGENAEYARQGLVFQLSGPWPPYSFSPSLEGRR